MSLQRHNGKLVTCGGNLVDRAGLCCCGQLAFQMTVTTETLLTVSTCERCPDEPDPEPAPATLFGVQRVNGWTVGVNTAAYDRLALKGAVTMELWGKQQFDTACAEPTSFPSTDWDNVQTWTGTNPSGSSIARESLTCEAMYRCWALVVKIDGQEKFICYASSQGDLDLCIPEEGGGGGGPCRCFAACTAVASPCTDGIAGVDAALFSGGCTPGPVGGAFWSISCEGVTVSGTGTAGSAEFSFECAPNTEVDVNFTFATDTEGCVAFGRTIKVFV